MTRLKMPKRVLAFALSLIICAGVFSANSLEKVDRYSATAATDVSEYAKKIQDINEKQQELDEKIKDAEKDIEDETEKQELIKKKISAVNEKVELLNSYMTQLEIEIAENQRKLDKQQKDIESGVANFKKRLRAMYLSGDNTYSSVLFESGDFYDMLMRMELIKRVAKHDNKVISDLIAVKNEYEQTKSELEKQQSDYDKQNEDLTSQKEELDKLYSSSEKLQKEYEDKKAELEKKNKEYAEEREAFETELSSLLSTSSNATREEAEAAANEALSANLSNTDFGWPVPSSYTVTSGIGARWGTQHNGIDIAGGKGSEICASESGTVVTINTTCTHNYGKSQSCGCGHGYGNYILIDHGNGFATLYGHLTSVNVNVGDNVTKGHQIGTMGSTGYSTGYHLHFELRYNGTYINPVSYLNL